jgi:hypothetical protein
VIHDNEIIKRRRSKQASKDTMSRINAKKIKNKNEGILDENNSDEEEQ